MVRGGGPKAGAPEVAAGAGTPPSSSDGDDAASTPTMDGLEDQQAQNLARFEAVNLGIAECLVGIGLGFIAGLLRGTVVLAVSFTSSAWSWIATICLIIASIVGAILHHLLGWLIVQFA